MSTRVGIPVTPWLFPSLLVSAASSAAVISPPPPLRKSNARKQVLSGRPGPAPNGTNAPDRPALILLLALHKTTASTSDF
eukprot:4571349-Amphidinium_carterae.1